ncbi:uncharacterized protein LOC113564296 [Drosophila erecta]|uniref:uncharacterized protein LOC113564296 n=1 Tax=Drosophila erecta TaxID=7220 RepID=UPI000F0707FA|nr:uncharacterized protein LOC113564296 [Drosophila erecta]
MNRLFVVTFLLTIGLRSVFSYDEDVVKKCERKVGWTPENASKKSNCYNLCVLEEHKVVVDGMVRIPDNIPQAKTCESLQTDKNDKCKLAADLRTCLAANTNDMNRWKFYYLYYH